MMHALIAFSSLSGNTKEVAEYVCHSLEHCDWKCDLFEIGYDAFNVIKDKNYDMLFLGSWSVDAGRTPKDVKDFVALWIDQDHHKHLPVAVFGTGETQWGEEYYCGAAHRLARFFKSPFPVLEIEQMPHHENDRIKIKKWSEDIITCGDTHEI